MVTRAVQSIRIVLIAPLLNALIATAQMPSPPPAPLGKLIDLGGYRLHLYCTGKGKQTVVLSPGGGDFSFDWYLVQQRVQEVARVCSYDRAGSAWSGPGPQPLTFRQEAYELNEALKLSHERGPYILVGHSLGGFVVRTFAEAYPKDTAGMILVDATSPDATLGYFGKLVRVRDLARRPIPEIHSMKSGPPQPISDEERDKDLKYKSPVIRVPYDRLPPNIQELQRWAQMLPRRVALSESTDYTPEEMQHLYETQQAGHPLGDKPLISIIGTHGGNDPPPADISQARWEQMHTEKIEEKRAFRTLSTNSKIVEDPLAGHAVHLEDPDAVVSAIHEIMNAVRAHSQLQQ